MPRPVMLHCGVALRCGAVFATATGALNRWKAAVKALSLFGCRCARFCPSARVGCYSHHLQFMHCPSMP
eukprot:1387881-Alexandrium_andersonii.AAC.1